MATNNQTHIINRDELVEVIKTEIESKATAPFINLTTETEVKMVKTSKIDGSINPYWKDSITKEATKTYLPVFDYASRVEKNMGKEGVEGSHELGNLSGKKHIGKCLLANLDETKQYIMVEYFAELSKGEPIYRHNGQVIEKSALENWITQPSNFYGSQGQERKVMVLTPLLSSIKRISVGGKNWEVVQETAPMLTSKVAQK